MRERRTVGTGIGRTLALLQGWYYVVGGLWPIVSPGTFQLVTGDKLDFWLAQTVGLQLAVAGTVLLLARRTRRITREVALLGLGQALVLGAVDVYCVAQPRTTPAYLLDAVAEFALAVAWIVALRSCDRPEEDPPA